MVSSFYVTNHVEELIGNRGRLRYLSLGRGVSELIRLLCFFPCLMKQTSLHIRWMRGTYFVRDFAGDISHDANRNSLYFTSFKPWTGISHLVQDFVQNVTLGSRRQPRYLIWFETSPLIFHVVWDVVQDISLGSRRRPEYLTLSETSSGIYNLVLDDARNM